MKNILKTILPILILALVSPLASFAQQGTPETQEQSLPSNEALYQSGIEFGVFLDQTEKRKDMWHGNFEKGQVSEALQKRADALHGTFYLIAVAVDGCSDSVNTIPYLAHLDQASDHISMRVVSPEAGKHIMEAHRTEDGRAATPTVLLLDEAFTEIGVFIERPKDLQDWAQGEGKSLSSNEFMKAKFAWYDEDLGNQTMSEVLDQLEAHLAKSGHQHD